MNLEQKTDKMLQACVDNDSRRDQKDDHMASTVCWSVAGVGVNKNVFVLRGWLTEIAGAGVLASAALRIYR